MTKPPYVLTENIINLVAEITKKTTKIEVNLEMKKDLFLRKASKIRSVNSSCAIEANKLSLEEVADVIDGQFVLAPKNEIIEVKNAYQAYLNIENFDQYGVSSFLEAHCILTEGLVKDSGNFRKTDVGVLEEGKVIHMGARPEFVPKLITELFEWASKSELHPLIKSSIVHFEIEFIHPFSDGNGRIGRLWQSLFLYKYNSLFEYIPIETLVFQNQQKYYESIAKSEIKNSATIFIEFMLEMILKTLEKFEPSDQLSQIKDTYKTNLSKTEKKVLNDFLIFYKDKEYIDIGIVKELIQKSEANSRKYLRKLVSLNILNSIGETKGRKYSLNKDIFI